MSLEKYITTAKLFGKYSVELYASLLPKNATETRFRWAAYWDADTLELGQLNLTRIHLMSEEEKKKELILLRKKERNRWQ